MLIGGQEGSGKCLVVNEVLIATRARWSGTHTHNTRHTCSQKGQSVESLYLGQ